MKQATLVFRFATVGALGFALQFAVLAALTSFAHWPWAPATIVAVELAVIHNYLWHEQWTWKERLEEFKASSALARFARFNVTNGLGSIAGNVALMWLFVRWFALPPVVANVLAVAAMSVANFAVADRWVFRPMRNRRLSFAELPVAQPFRAANAGLKPCATYFGTGSKVFFAFIALASASNASAGPTRITLDAWQRYVAGTEAQLERSRGSSRQVSPDLITAKGDSINVPSGTISHWHGSVFIRGLTLDRLLDGLMRPGTPPPQEDVVASRVLARGPDTLRVYIRLVRRAIVTVTYDTEHEMTFERRTPTLAAARSIATRIEEVGGSDHGFLWRLHSYWQYEAKPGGVLVELESITLSRDVPSVVRFVASPLVDRVARESMFRTLEALRRFFQTSA